MMEASVVWQQAVLRKSRNAFDLNGDVTMCNPEDPLYSVINECCKPFHLSMERK